MGLPAKHLYEFGPFVLDADERVLLREGQPVSLAPKAFDTLLALIEKSGRIVGKDELLNRVWPDSFVEEGNLAFNISVLRKALAGGADNVQFIETVPKRGYRFVTPVRQMNDASPDVLFESQTISRVVIEEQRDDSEQQIQISSPKAIVERAAQTSSARRAISIRSVLIGCVVVLGIVAVIAYLRVSGPTSPRTLAVLPFKPLAANSSDEYLELGMADALITRLSNLKEIVVRPTSSVLKYAAAGQDPIAAGRELSVDAVLDGSVQRSGDTIRVTVRLVRVGDGVPLWADKFDENFTNIFSVQDSISERMARALTLNLSGEEKNKITKRYTDDVEAYQLYLKGRYYWNKRTEGSYQRAVDYFQQAINKDSGYALAYSGLADSYSFLSSQGIQSPRDVFPLAEAAARKAIELDDSLAEAHTSLAYVRLYYDWDWPGAEREYTKAIKLNPNYATPHHGYAYYLISTGRTDQAIAEIKRAQELDPLSLIINTDHAEFYYFARRPDQAIEQLQKAIDLDPSFVRAHFLLGRAYAQKGNCEQAIAEFQKARSLEENGVEMLGALAQGYASCGKGPEARKVLGELLAIDRTKQHYISPHWIAATYAALGDTNEGFAWLDKAFERRFGPLIYLKVNPIWDGLRSDPRFADRLKLVGLN